MHPRDPDLTSLATLIAMADTDGVVRYRLLSCDQYVGA